jgi:myo-inositol-1(or 4)-monophosphatase
MEIGTIKQIALGAAHEAGRVLFEGFGRPHSVRKKGPIDLVTEADIASEKTIVRIIQAAFPGHRIVSEEEGAISGNKAETWIVDPLDGTTNYAHNIPVFAVSIAFALAGETVLGLVFNPVSGELFLAEKGQGAFLNGAPVSVSKTETLSQSLLVTGFPYELSARFDGLISRFSKCLKASQGVRRFGSAALDLCYVACGRFDGFWEENLKPWDTAAGALIAAEAGGSVTTFGKGPFSPEAEEILATNGRIHDQISALLCAP